MLLWQATVNIECLCALICDCGVAPTKLMHIFSQARLCATPDVSQTRAQSTMAGPPSQRHLRHSEQLPAQGKKNEPPGGGSGVNREASNGVDRIHSDPENWMKRIVQLIG